MRPWRTRLGGDIYTAFPYVASALWGIEHYLPRISEFHQRAQTLSQQIVQTLGEQALPFAVQSNGFVVELAIDPQVLTERALQIAEKEKIWLFDRVYNHDGVSRIEIQVGDALDDWRDDELAEKLLNVIE